MRKSRRPDASDLAAKIQAGRARKDANAITAVLGPLPDQPRLDRLRWLLAARLMEGRLLCALLYSAEIARLETLPDDLENWSPPEA